MLVVMFSHEVADDVFDNGINSAVSCEKCSKKKSWFSPFCCFVFCFGFHFLLWFLFGFLLCFFFSLLFFLESKMKFSLALVFCLVAAVSAEVIYVSSRDELLSVVKKANSGDKIVLKPGQYRGIHLENFKKGLTISGAGSKDVDVFTFEIYGGQVTIEDFYFEDTDVSISLLGTSGVTIRRCTFTNIERNAIVVASSTNVVITDNRFKYDALKASVCVLVKEDSASSVKITGNTFIDYKTALVLHPETGVFEVSNNIFKASHSSTAIHTAGKDVKIAGNQCEMKSSSKITDQYYYGFVYQHKGKVVMGPSNIVFLSTENNNTYAAYASEIPRSTFQLCKSNRISVSGNAKVSNGVKVDPSC